MGKCKKFEQMGSWYLGGVDLPGLDQLEADPCAKAISLPEALWPKREVAWMASSGQYSAVVDFDGANSNARRGGFPYTSNDCGCP
jgi:hypothetical protein